MVTRNQLASVLFSNMSPCAHYAVTINTLLYKVPAFLSLILVTASYGGILNEADDNSRPAFPIPPPGFSD
ncbi:hypothetical protein K503DRAFT_68701 [Rhizopogon vinicolor AM-OR11-026]|uniref:Uncharacterized protein n=1 Tax=Rhizopogon vinicolor AM-OR11-026 TaxID=1314800 RepID=A0A1B7NG37_9AGAM|nr:hypothetical protein K503DRAFT_68701 [Rhizopogon vinicolor AM-OR11-026]